MTPKPLPPERIKTPRGLGINESHGSAFGEDKVLLAKVEVKLEQTRDLLEERTRERDQARRERDINAEHIRRREIQGRLP
jgi:hypothetical protein